MDIAEETYISLCAGVGGLDLGLRLALPNARCVCYVEREAFCCANLVDKTEQGWLDYAPVWTDIKTFDGKPWRGKVRGLIGGYPCQPFSVAGKRKSTADERWIWPDIKRLVCEIRPDWCFFENVAGHLRLGFDRVLSDLAEIGYDVCWTVIAAGDVGATHQRKRLFILAYRKGEVRLGTASEFAGQSTFDGKALADTKQPRRAQAGERCGQFAGPEPEERGRELADASQRNGGKEPLTNQRPVSGKDREMGNPESIGTRPGRLSERENAEKPVTTKPRRKLGDPDATRPQGWDEPDRQGADQLPTWPPSPSDRDAWRQVLEADPSLEPAICGVADGLASRVDRLRACGNGVVPIQAAVAFCTLVDFARSLE